MSLTFGQAKDSLSQYVGRGGKCPTAADTDSFVKQVLQYLLYSGEYGNTRKFCFHAVRGCFTAPYELEVPEKVKIDGEVGSVWDKWFEWHQNAYLHNCIPAQNAIFEEPNYVYTAYGLPANGAQIGCVATCEEACDAHMIVKCRDLTGREVYTNHNGEQISGVYLSIKKGVLQHTDIIIGEITGIVKTPTNGYVQLLWINQQAGVRGFLSDYSPVEEKPAYRQFRLMTRCPQFCKVSVLGKIRLKENYKDNDLIPFDNLWAISLAGQTMNSIYNNDMQTGVAKNTILENVLEKENEYKKINNGQPMEVFRSLSGGAIVNIIGPRTWFSNFRGRGPL